MQSPVLEQSQWKAFTDLQADPSKRGETNDTTTCIFHTSWLHNPNDFTSCHVLPVKVAHEPPLPQAKTESPKVVAEVAEEDVLQEVAAPLLADLECLPAPSTEILQHVPAPFHEDYGQLEAQLTA